MFFIKKFFVHRAKEVITNKMSFQFLLFSLCFALFLSFLAPAFKVVATENAESSNATNQAVVYLRDYNTDPTGREDSGAGIYQALQKAKELSATGKEVSLYFEPKASYTIKKEFAQVRNVHTSNTDSVRFPNKHIAVLIEGINNLTIEGQGAEFIVEGDMMALGIFQSENIVIKNLSWDYRIPTTSEITVFDFDETNKTVDYFVPKYMSYELRGSSIRWTSELNSAGQYYWTADNDHTNYGISVKYPTEKMGRSYYDSQGPFRNVRSIQKLDNGLLRVTYNRNFSITPVKGMNYQLVSNAVRPTSGALVWESKDVKLEQVRISYMHGFGFLIQMSENVTFDGIRMETDPRTGKFTASYADGIHISGAKGKITIKNSFFNNTHDDPINIHGTFTRVEERVNNRTLRLNYIHKQQGGFPQFYPGDKVVFYSRDTLESRDNEQEYTVKTAERPSSSSLKSMLVEFEEDLPEYLSERIGREPKYVAENITYAPEVEILNNKFLNVFTRHILVTSRKKVLIEGNDFEAASMPATFFSNDSNEWYESGPIRDLTIKNNIFRIRSLGRTWWKYSPAIYFHPVTKGGGFPNYSNPIHKNIVITGNTFYLESDGALRAESVENLKFENNKIYRLNPNISLQLTANNMAVGENQVVNLAKNGTVVNGLASLPGGPEGNSGSVANVLEFQASKNIIVRNNEYDDGLKKHVLIEAMPDSEYQITDDLSIYKNRREIAEPSSPVGKVYYASTNPEIATIDNNGLLTARSVGETEIFAYTIWNDTLIKSNISRIQVTAGSSENKLELDKLVFTLDDVNPTFTLTKDGQEIEKATLSFESLNPNILTFNEGNLVVRETGIAEVRVTQGDKKASIFIAANYTPSQFQLAPYLSVENQNSNISIANEEIILNRNSNEDLWEGTNNLNNLIHLSLQNKNVNRLAAQIKLQGLPVRQSRSWDSSYFILFKLKEDGSLDRNNYISVGKRAHSDGFATVKEENQRGFEAQTNNQAQNNQTTMTFAIEKENNVVRLYFVENGTYHEVHTYNDASFLGNNLALGVGAWGNTQENRTLTISDFKLVEGSKEDLASSSVLPFKVRDDSSAEISDTTIVYEESTHETRVEANSAHRLHTIVEGRNSVKKQTEALNFSESGSHKIYVINENVRGKLSSPTVLDYDVSSDQIAKYINGTLLTQNITLPLPSDLTKLAYLEGNNLEVLNVTENTSNINKGGHIISLRPYLSNEAKITNIRTSIGNPSMEQDNQFIYTDDASPLVTLNITTSTSTAKLEVYNPDHDQRYEASSNVDLNIPIYNGLNTLELIATARDNITKDVYRLHILRNHKILDGVAEIKIKGEIASENTSNFTVSSLNDFSIVPNAVNARVSYHVLNETDNRVELLARIEHEDKLSVEYRTYNLTVESREEDTTEDENTDSTTDSGTNDSTTDSETTTEADADYSSVRDAKRQIPENLSNYTEQSVRNLELAVASVIEGKKVSAQTEVDGYATAILEAVRNLQLKPANYAHYEEVKSLVPSDLSIYTENSVGELNKLLNVDISNKTILQQAEVDTHTEAIRNAINNLQLIRNTENEELSWHPIMLKAGNTSTDVSVLAETRSNHPFRLIVHKLDKENAIEEIFIDEIDSFLESHKNQLSNFKLAEATKLRYYNVRLETEDDNFVLPNKYKLNFKVEENKELLAILHIKNFDTDASELEVFEDARKNPQAAKVFNLVENKAVIETTSLSPFILVTRDKEKRVENTTTEQPKDTKITLGYDETIYPLFKEESQKDLQPSTSSATTLSPILILLVISISVFLLKKQLDRN